jgi:hypothetical protein
MLNRRRFVYGILSAGVLGPGLAGKASGAPTPAVPDLAGRLSKGVFLALRRQTFTAVIDQRRVPFVLTAVTDDGTGNGLEQFTVHFRAPAGLRLRDGDCLLSHPKAGTTRLYVQRGQVDEGGSHYKAPFNLLS